MSVHSQARTRGGKTRRMLGLCAAATAITLSVAACSNSNAADGASGGNSLTELNVTPGFFYLPAFATQDAASDHGLSLQMTSVTGGGPAGVEFAGGEGDLLAAGLDTDVQLVQKGTADITILGTYVATNTFILVSEKGSQFTSLDSLKGQKVGITSSGSVSELGLKAKMVTAGLDPSKDFQLVALGAIPEQIAALQRGTAAAVMINGATLASMSSELQVVSDMRDQSYADVVIAAKTDDVKANPSKYCAFEASLQQGSGKLFSDHSYATTLGTKEFGSTTDASDLQVDLQEGLNSHWTKTGAFTEDQYNSSKKIMLDSGEFTDENFPTYDQLTSNQPKCS